MRMLTMKGIITNTALMITSTVMSSIVAMILGAAAMNMAMTMSTGKLIAMLRSRSAVTRMITNMDMTNLMSMDTVMVIPMVMATMSTVTITSMTSG